MLDSIIFEKRGIPAVAIITDGFIETGRAMAQSWGLPRYQFLTMPHPISNLTENELYQRAREIVPKIVQFLVEGKE